MWRAATRSARVGHSFDAPVRPTIDGLEVAPLYSDRPAEDGVPWLPLSHRALGAVHDATGLASLDEERRGGATLAWIRDESARIVALSARGLEVPQNISVILEPLDDLAPLLSAELDSAWIRTICDENVCSSTDVQRTDALARAVSSGRHVLGARAWGESHASLELAISASSFVSTLRAMEARSVPLSAAVSATTFLVTLGTDFFANIAKLRALRRVIARVLDAARIDERPHVAARGEWRMISALDRDTNMLRSTLAASAGLLGGADSVAMFAHDVLAGRSANGTRIARNTSLILALEAHLDAPRDPARGSYAIEHMTDALAGEAWASVQRIEASGGLSSARTQVLEWIAASAAAREDALRTRRAVRVGVSRFVADERSALPESAGEHRDSCSFEHLRSRGQELSAILLVTEKCPEARIDFARELALLVASTVEVVRAPATLPARSPLVIVCAADAEPLLDVIAEVKSAGGIAVAVAGKPGPNEEQLRAAGVDEFVFVSADIAGVLEHLLERATEQVHESHP